MADTLSPITMDNDAYILACRACGLAAWYETSEENHRRCREYLVTKYSNLTPGSAYVKEWYQDAILALQHAPGGLEAPPETPKSRTGVIWGKDEDGVGSKEELAKRSRESSDAFIARSGTVNLREQQIAKKDLDAIMILENRGITNAAQQLEREKCERILGTKSGSQELDERAFVYRELGGRQVVDWAKTEVKRAENKAKNEAARKS